MFVSKMELALFSVNISPNTGVLVMFPKGLKVGLVTSFPKALVVEETSVVFKS